MTIKNEEICMISFAVVLIYIMYKIRKNKLTIVEASDNGMKLMVYNDKDKRKSADLLAEIIKRMFMLRNTLINEKNKYPEYKQYIELLEENLTEERTKIYENDPNSDLTSFSVNKGEELAFCLKSKRNGQIHEANLLIYVALHEMAHIACPEIGHGDLFKKIFRFLTLKAIDMGIYQKVDYNQSPVEYCGMVLSSSIV
jgi:predicted metal-dependent hydrolase